MGCAGGSWMLRAQFSGRRHSENGHPSSPFAVVFYISCENLEVTSAVKLYSSPLTSIPPPHDKLYCQNTSSSFRHEKRKLPDAACDTDNVDMGIWPPSSSTRRRRKRAPFDLPSFVNSGLSEGEQRKNYK